MTQSLLAPLGSSQAVLLFHPGIKSCPPPPKDGNSGPICSAPSCCHSAPPLSTDDTQAPSSSPLQIPPQLNLGKLPTLVPRRLPKPCNSRACLAALQGARKLCVTHCSSADPSGPETVVSHSLPCALTIATVYSLPTHHRDSLTLTLTIATMKLSQILCINSRLRPLCEILKHG